MVPTEYLLHIVILASTIAISLLTCGKKKPAKAAPAKPAAAPAAAPAATEQPAEPNPEEPAQGESAPGEGAEQESGGTIGVFPRQMAWEYESGQSTFLVKNSTEKTFGIKVKVTNPNIYSAAPTHCIVGPHKSLTIVVLRKAGPFKDDKIIVCYAMAEVADTDAKEFFKKEGLKLEQIEITQKPKKETKS